VAALAIACGDGGGGPTDLGTDVPGDPGVTPDVPADPGEPDVPPGDEGPQDPGQPGDAPADAEEVIEDATADADVATPLPPLPIKPPLATPADPLADKDVESCAVYQAESCVAGKKMACAVYDTTTDAFVEPDPMLRRVLLLERWRDLYNKPDGMTSERNFKNPTLPGTPEEVWAAYDNFSSQEGMGDSGIWTGWTVIGDILRYSQTGTEADYQRMEDGIRTLVTMYEVTGVPGYFIRYFFLLLPDGTPNDPAHVFRYESSRPINAHTRDVDEDALALLPAVYRDGVEVAEGEFVKGRPMWYGRPSIDQNTGPMNALPMAYAMLKDEALKDRIEYHLTCYLNRLKRIEIINLDQNPGLRDTLMQFFGSGGLNLDPDDMDLTKIKSVVGYVQHQINTANEATYDRTCPAGPPRENWRTIDAAGDTFILDMLELTGDMGTGPDNRENQIDHYYFPNIRGGDTIHLLHLAAMAYWFTGEEQYREFFFRDIIEDLDGLRVIATTGAYDQLKWCSHFFGDQLTYGSWWVLLGMLEDGELKTELQKQFHMEMWDKLLKQKGNADFYLMYAGEVPEDMTDGGRQQALDYALTELATMGGNGFVEGEPVLDDPRRSYTLTPEFVLAHADGIVAECPTQEEIDLCNQEIEFMGTKIPGANTIDYIPCDDANPYVCKHADGKCSESMASAALPVALRQHTDWLWQRNPYALMKGVGREGGTQYPGNDLSEPYWNARRYGFITEGAGQVLAWQEIGTCDD
jgi:hypothetical protein